MNLTLGIEEELMVVSEDTGDAVADPDPAIFETCARNRGPHQIVDELLRSQIETGTRVCTSIAQLRASLYETRSIVIDGARRHGTAVIASSTHPFARWQEQRVTARRRYEEAEIAYQQEVRRFFVGGMHIHAGFGTPDLRIKVMTAIRPYLPLLLALSASSPFYSGQLTGLKSYRQSVIGGLPRTGMPGPIHSYADYVVGAGNATLAAANSVREEGAVGCACSKRHPSPSGVVRGAGPGGFLKCSLHFGRARKSDVTRLRNLDCSRSAIEEREKTPSIHAVRFIRDARGRPAFRWRRHDVVGESNAVIPHLRFDEGELEA